MNEGERFALRTNAHLSRDETAAKMGHPVLWLVKRNAGRREGSRRPGGLHAVLAAGFGMDDAEAGVALGPDQKEQIFSGGVCADVADEFVG